jgi:DNA-directed RNA polymerase subunit RPC12/RpoP
MLPQHTYTCPRCSTKCPVGDNEADRKVTCPKCSLEFFAAASAAAQPPPLPISQTAQQFVLPAKMPFFKSGRRKILDEKIMEFASTGMIDDATESKLEDFAVALGLKKGAATQLLTQHFTEEFDRIKRRMESAFLLTDYDLEEIEGLKRKYNVRLTLTGTAPLFRSIYLLESKHELPAPIEVALYLDADETCYYEIPTTWHQSRAQTHGYSGTSISVPMGLRGVRFRFGGYTPIRTEQMTPLSSGTLFVTSKRLLFSGDSRNTTISLKKIVDGHVYSDCVKIEKSTAKPDLFSMNAGQARYVLSLVGVLKER